MFQPRLTGFLRRFQKVAALMLVGAAGLASLPATAADSVRETTSLRFVPAEASFYVSALRLREQYDAIVNSRAVARVMALPAIKLAREAVEKLKSEAGGPDASEYEEWLAQPENKELTDLLADAVSHEVFLYGDAGYAELLAVMSKLQTAMRTAQLEAARDGEEQGKVLARRMLELWSKEVDNIKVPRTVIGFKVTDTKRAESQLARLEMHINAELEKHPQWKGRLSREKVGSVDLLTLKLDGSLIPWDQVPREELEENKEQFDQLVEKVKKMTLVVSIGIRDGYLLVSLGDTSAHLASLGKGKLLFDQPELAPLRKHAEKPMTSMGYVSRRFLEQSNTLDSQIEGYVAMAEQLLPLSEVDEALQKELIADAKAFAQDVKKYIPKPGAQTAFGFLSPRGLEGFSYDWSEHRGVDGSQKLTILDHVGGNPLAFAAVRAKQDPADYELTVKWLKRVIYYGEAIGLDHLEPEQRAMYDRVRGELTPLVQRLDDVTRKMWIPAFKDGQTAFVLDAKTASKQWQSAMPPSDKPLPMLEVGLVHAVSDATLVRRASSEYFAIVQEAIKKLHAIFPEQIPDIDLTLPQWREFPEGMIYYYNLPMEWGVDTQVAPNAALSSEFLALSLVPKFSLRLLKNTPLEVEGPLTGRDRPLAAAGYFHWAGFVDAVAPWIDYGIEQGNAQRAVEETGTPDIDVKEHVAAVLDLLRCLRTMSSVSYFEEGALVTHSEWHLVDQK